MKNILITGGAGFIGSHVAEEFFKKGYNITVLDDLSSTGHIQNLTNVTAKFIEASLSNHKIVDQAVQNIDYICHLAAVPSVIQSIKDPISSSAQNVHDTVYLMHAADKAGVKKLIFSSSASIYGNGIIPFNPLSPYAASKAAIEMFAQSFNKCYNMQTVILRYFNVYGPRQIPTSFYSGVITKLLHCAKTKQKFTVNGDGEQIRDYVHVKDVAHANVLATETENICEEAMDIGSGISTPLNYIISKIREVSDFSIAFGPHIEGEARSSISNISLAKKYINYEPQIQLADGLRDLILSA